MFKKQTFLSMVYIIVFIIIVFLMLTNAPLSLQYARKGLDVWFENMVPTLLPFMILSGTLVRMGLTDGFTALVYPFLKPVFRISKSACYVMVMGFMCGFPMGAKCIEDLYCKGRLNDREAAWLLSFCNNIGPIYFVSFAVPLIGCKQLLPCVIGMYGLPLLYGLVGRYTVFKSMSSRMNHHKIPYQPMGLLDALNESVYASVQSILMLGGYMILFNLLMLVPHLGLGDNAGYIAPLLEITGGLSRLKDHAPGYSLVMLAFGGLSCIAQTYSCISQTNLSIQKYIGHKLALAAITGIYYFLCLRFWRLW